LGNKVQFYFVTSKLQELYVFLGVLSYLLVLYFGLQKLSAKSDKSTSEKVDKKE